MSSIILFAKDNPKPHPVFLVLNPGLKIFFQSFFGIPFPLSFILTLNSFKSFLSEMFISPLSLSIESILFFIIFSMDHANNDPFALIIIPGCMSLTNFTVLPSDGSLYLSIL